jgi:4-hydroxybenzoate polyprenyltransferase
LSTGNKFYKSNNQLSHSPLRKAFDFFLFTSLFIACCAVVMVYQTYSLILQKPFNIYLAAFVFFATVCSYNFHWFLTPYSSRPSQRLEWDEQHKKYHLFLSIAGLIGAVVFFYFFKEHWFYIGGSAVLTFLYSAPKISIPPFQWLKKVAVGKTIFLAAIWAYVTAALPILIENDVIGEKEIFFCIGQFFFIYAICILFDFRDREDDKADGIRSMITYFNEKGIDVLFMISITIFAILTLLLQQTGIGLNNIILLLIPAIILVCLYRYSKKNFSDFLYYFILDGLMMLSGLLLWLVNRF